MIYKKILVPVVGNMRGETTFAAAFALAQVFKAHVDAYYFWPDPEDVLPYFGQAEELSEETRVRLVKDVRVVAGNAAGRVRDTFAAALAQAEATEVEGPQVPRNVTARWSEIAARAEKRIPRMARNSDITVFHAPPSNYDRLMLSVPERTLLYSGRPVLFAPSGSLSEIGRRITLAWNGSVQATRAVSAALGLLSQADCIDVVVIEETDRPTPDPKELIEHLAWHGLTGKGTIRHLAGKSVGERIIESAKQEEADLLVIGGYAHSRLQEAVFGGTTRHVILNTTIPVIMMH